MKILMVTNTYTPIVGGVERSILSFTEEFRKSGHEVFVLAPEFNGMPENEENVIRVKAIRQFNGSDFSVRLPIPIEVEYILKDFVPDIVHAHHPFLLGDTALRIASKYQIPLVFTHHTKYEDYTHYVPGDSEAMKRFIVELATGYAQLADHVIAPSRGIADLIKERGVTTPVSVIPTGIDIERFSKGDGQAFRQQHNLSKDDFVIGYVGRLTKEKNLDFLSMAVAEFLKGHPDARFLIVGKGPSENVMAENLKKQNVYGQAVMAGVLNGQSLIDAYHAMDVFAFSSKTETQGVVLAEAMAAGVPVVAIQATGVNDVLKDKVNGRMLPREDRQSFVDGLHWVYGQSSDERERLRQDVKDSIGLFSIQKTARDILNIYNELIIRGFTFSDIENSLWAQATARLKTEWDLLSNVADAVGSAFQGKTISEMYNESLFVKLRRWLSSNEWTARLMGLSQSVNTEAEPGLVLIQIDGLSETQFKDALKNGRMPFLQKLIKKEHYQTHPFYSGQPSSTPGVQAELFYGVKGAVPSFSFLDVENRKVFKMINDASAVEVERELKKQNEGLLQGGSSYSNIYSGGAKESHFCSVDLGWDQMWRKIKPAKLLFLLVIHLYSILMTAGKIFLELILSLLSFLKGLLTGRSLGKELNFILTRLAICILLRDFITFGAKIDVIRGLPVIHLNFLGYDEHAHRRGPSSKFAHWALRGIDWSIAKIYKETLRSTRRSYDIWIYSDHGQEGVRSYTAENKKSAAEMVKEVFFEYFLEQHNIIDDEQEGIQAQRVNYLGHWLFKKFFPLKPFHQEVVDKDKLVVTAMGPIGHIYLPRRLTRMEESDFAQRLVDRARIPLVLAKGEHKTVIAWNKDGKFILPDDRKRVLGETHPFLDAATEDLIRNCHHKNAGDFMISGWIFGEQPYSFPLEGGAHGGPGLNETNGFVMVPSDIEVKEEGCLYSRPAELRKAALEFMGRGNDQERALEKICIQTKADKKTESIRVMTYNVHGCKGLDGKISVERIARVIARYRPDIVALQELDCNRGRSGIIDQPHLISKYLEMMHHFYPSLTVEEGHYGNAILSRFPMTCIKADRLPGIAGNQKLEPRGAIWTEIDVHGFKMQFLNTHLGLGFSERKNQVEELLGNNWLGHSACQGPVVLCGDFNALAQSYVCRLVRQKFYDAQIKMENHKPKATWFGHFPLTRIDHVFLSPDFNVTGVEVARAHLARIASDHLPLIVELKVKSA